MDGIFQPAKIASAVGSSQGGLMGKAVSGVNPKILAWARRRSGHSVEDVGRALGKDPLVIDSWERGEEAPTYVQLETLAYRVYKRPIALFFFPEPPSEPDTEREFRTLPDAEIRDLAADTRYKIREARAAQISLAELAGGARQAERRITRDLGGSTTGEVSVLAAAAREYLAVSIRDQESFRTQEEALKRWRAAVESAGVFVFKDSFKQREVSGFALFDDEFPLIVINNSTSQSRQVFTLFHELAHLLARTNGVTKQDDRYILRLSGEPRKIEIFCNRFAAEFLVPESRFREEITRRGTGDAAVADLANLFKVSREVILRRMLDHRLITKERYDDNRWADDFESSAASQSSGGNYYATHASYLSERYARLAFRNYYRGEISIEQLADYLRVSAKSVPGIEQFVLRPATG